MSFGQRVSCYILSNFYIQNVKYLNFKCLINIDLALKTQQKII